MVLGNALSHPQKVADLLLPQLHVGVEAAVVKLLLKRVHSKPHLFLVQHLVQQLPLGLAHLGGVSGNKSFEALKLGDWVLHGILSKLLSRPHLATSISTKC